MQSVKQKKLYPEQQKMQSGQHKTDKSQNRMTKDVALIDDSCFLAMYQLS